METKEMELQNLEDSLFEKDDSAHVNADKMSRPSLTYWSDAWRRFKGNKVAMVSAVVLILIIGMAIVQPIVLYQNNCQ